MAQPTRRRTENVSGNFYVDDSCIDCDTCRWMAPEIFHRENRQSSVYQQPAGQENVLKALHALISCPTASIGFAHKPDEWQMAQKAFPLPVAENVYHCGYHSEKSFGAASYLIVRPEGNILIDSPRFNRPLAQKLEALGGVKYLFLTHRDDVADHRQFQQHFGCVRILHEDDVSESTRDVEWVISGQESQPLEKDSLMIPVPGHTKGSVVLLYKGKFLFTGDHLAYSQRWQHLYAFRSACWYSWDRQIESMSKLKKYSFTWVLPGHGRRYFNDQSMPEALETCIQWMQEHPVFR